MTFDPLVPLSPFEKIEAINRIAGRQTGSRPGGYVDENGTPIVPDWSGAGEHQVVGSVPTAESVYVGPGAVEVNAAGEGGFTEGTQAQDAPEAATALLNLVELEGGMGVWRQQAFVLAPGELLKVRRVVVAAIRRGLREQSKALGAELSPRRTKAKRRSKPATPPEAKEDIREILANNPLVEPETRAALRAQIKEGR